eukprot:6734311-Prymnesium_polylepis.1
MTLLYKAVPCVRKLLTQRARATGPTRRATHALSVRSAVADAVHHARPEETVYGRFASRYSGGHAGHSRQMQSDRVTKTESRGATASAVKFIA